MLQVLTWGKPHLSIFGEPNGAELIPFVIGDRYGLAAVDILAGDPDDTERVAIRIRVIGQNIKGERGILFRNAPVIDCFRRLILLHIRDIDREGLDIAGAILTGRLDMDLVRGGAFVVDLAPIAHGDHARFRIHREGTVLDRISPGIDDRVSDSIAIGIARAGGDADFNTIGGVLCHRIGRTIGIGYDAHTVIHRSNIQGDSAHAGASMTIGHRIGKARPAMVVLIGHEGNIPFAVHGHGAMLRILHRDDRQGVAIGIRVIGQQIGSRYREGGILIGLHIRDTVPFVTFGLDLVQTHHFRFTEGAIEHLHLVHASGESVVVVGTPASEVQGSASRVDIGRSGIGGPPNLAQLLGLAIDIEPVLMDIPIGESGDHMMPFTIVELARIRGEVIPARGIETEFPIPKHQVIAIGTGNHFPTARWIGLNPHGNRCLRASLAVQVQPAHGHLGAAEIRRLADLAIVSYTD